MMKVNLNKKARASIYLKAAELLTEGVSHFGCTAIKDALCLISGYPSHIIYNYLEIDDKTFPEFMLFKDQDKYAWLSVSDECTDISLKALKENEIFGKHVRETVLLLCYEMTK
jgi:hypothetical protein